MKLIPLIAAADTAQARRIMLATLQLGCGTYRRWIGWQGGSGEYDVQWNSKHGFWLRADETPYFGRWIIWFGNEHPENKRMLAIVCEINPPEDGINRQCGGLFVRDDNGSIYFAHSGKIGGGRKGIGKSAFLSAYRGTRERVAWPDGKKSEVIVLGRIDGDRFAAQIANFISEVQRFKASAAQNGENALNKSAPPEPQFNPEFSGKRNGYRMPPEIEARCDHGLVVSALANALQAIGIGVANDQNRDLYIPSHKSRMRILFEVKTDVTTSSVYQAIGQLHYHSALQTPPPSLVMVLPGTPNTETKRVLVRLQIKVLVFGWEDSQPVFRNLRELIR